MRTQSVESDPTNPASQTAPEWAAQFNRLLMSWAQVQPNGKAQVQERDLSIDPSRVATPERIAAAEASIGKDFRNKKDKSLWTVSNAFPSYGSFDVGGASYLIRLHTVSFQWEPIPGGRDCDRRKKYTCERLIDADVFFSEHELIPASEDPVIQRLREWEAKHQT